MPEIVNLNRFRKAKAKASDKAQAAANRTKHGRPKGEKAREKAEASLAERKLDGVRKDEGEG